MLNVEKWNGRTIRDLEKHCSDSKKSSRLVGHTCKKKSFKLEMMYIKAKALLFSGEKNPNQILRRPFVNILCTHSINVYTPYAYCLQCIIIIFIEYIIRMYMRTC